MDFFVRALEEIRLILSKQFLVNYFIINRTLTLIRNYFLITKITFRQLLYLKYKEFYV